MQSQVTLCFLYTCGLLGYCLRKILWKVIMSALNLHIKCVDISEVSASASVN